MIKIYGQLMSRAPRCVWLLEELGLEYEHIPVNQMDGGTQKPDFLAINPNGKVPAMQDDDVTLFESMAINLYLGRKYGNGLWPANEADQARTTQWSFWGMTEIEPPEIVLLVQKMFTPEDERDAAKIKEAEEMLPRPLNVLEAHLADREYLLGNTFSLADLNLSSVCSILRMVGADLSPYPTAGAWLNKCLSREAYTKLMADS